MASDSANIKYIATKAEENKNEILLQLFDPTEKHYPDVTGKFPVQSDKGNNYILVAYNYDASNILINGVQPRTSIFIHGVSFE